MAELSLHETFAHYRIRSRIGAGGMGDVYLAEDLRLRRPVALKVLRSNVDRESIDRFVREARAASAMNHPNAAHIYEIGQLGEVVYIAMEYVEGTSLEQRLESGPLPVEEAIALAIQIADALGEAHAKGIVHRDLKPGNIVINARGQAKILDFGLAVMTRSEDLSPTDTPPRTVMGTIPYMSPEQTRAKPVDHRSDIFSFGVILYEMVAGVRPFDGEGVLDTMLKIAEGRAPAITRAGVPDALRRIIDRCLEKEREKRYPTPSELVADLRQLLPSAQPATPPRTRPVWASLVVAALILGAMAVIVRRVLDTRETPSPPSRVTKITSGSGLEDEPAISPNGQLVAYTSDERGNLDVFVAPIRGGQPVRITDSDADDAQPAWSPDGTRIAFVSARERSGRLSIVLGQALGNFVNAQGGDLFVVSARGGVPIKVFEHAYYPAWSPDGQWIVFQSGRGGGLDLWKVRADGGQPVQLTRDLHFDYQPSWSPDGKWIVYGSGMPGPYRLKIIAPSGGTPRVLSDGKDAVLLRPVFSADGKSILYASTRGGSLNLWRLPVPRAGAKAEPPRQLTLGIGDDVNPAVSANGKRIVYAAGRQTPDLWTLDVATGKAEQITFDTGKEEYPHRSRDGVIAFTSDRGGTDAIWLRDASGQMKMFMTRTSIGQTRWSPDATRIAYRHEDRGATTTFVRDLRNGATKMIARMAETPSWSPDGKQLTFTWWEKQYKGQIQVQSLETGAQKQITSLDLITSYPTFSPDGRFVSFQATRDDGTRHVWIAEVATGRMRRLTSGASEDSHPQWSPVDPDRILFVRNHENLMTLSVSTGEVRNLTNYAEPNHILDYPAWSPDGTKIDFSIARKRGDLYLIESE